MSRLPFLRPGVGAHIAAAGRLGWMAVRHFGVAARIAVGHLVAGIVALLVIFMEWGWRPLAALLGQLARLKPFAALENVVRGLPPYAALAVFVLPSVLILPLKLLALYLVANGQKAAAVALFVGAKVIGTALVARIFMLTQATLMRIGWFARVYNWVMPIKTALIAWVRESAVWQSARAAKARLKTVAAPLVARAKALAVSIRTRLFGPR
jgi:hypothetical protein